MKNILTTAAASGVLVRYLSTILGTIVATTVTLGYLNAEQGQVISQNIDVILGAIGAIVAASLPIYAAIFKSSSDKAAEVAKQVDQKIAPEKTVVIETPPGQPDIVVTAK